MTTLILDTSLHVAQAALCNGDGAVIQHVAQHGARGQTDMLLPVLRELMQGRAYSQLTALVVTTGPGVFTGIRAGIAAARALRLSLDIPLCGVGTLDVLLAQTGATHALIDAHKSEAYVQGPQNEHALLGFERLAAFLKDAKAIAVYPAAFAKNDVVSSFAPQNLSVVDRLDPAAIYKAAQRAPREPMPLYVRAPDALPQAAKTLIRRAPGGA